MFYSLVDVSKSTRNIANCVPQWRTSGRLAFMGHFTACQIEKWFLYKLFFALLTLKRRATQCFRNGKNTLKNSEFLEKSAFNEAIIVELS